MKTGETFRWRFPLNDGLATAVGVLEKIDELTSIVPTGELRVIRNGKITSDRVVVPLKDLTAAQDMAVVSTQTKREKAIRSPSEDDLKKINALMPRGAAKRSEANTMVVSFSVADNLVNRSLEKWDIKSLEDMPSLLKGKPMMINHDTRQVGMTWGRVFDASYEHADSAPAIATGASGNRSSNLKITKKEGYGVVLVDAFTSPTNIVFSMIKDGFIGRISTGGFNFKDFHCPHCDCSFRDEKCPHYPPDVWWGYTSERYPDKVSEYAIRVGLFDMGEVSVVAIPNLPSVGVI